jgi:hypothetical protein
MSFIEITFLNDKGPEYVLNGMTFAQQPSQVPEQYLYFLDASEIKTIENGFFQGDNTIFSIQIPNIIETIGEMAFKDCANLTNVSLSFNKNFTVLKRELFKGCTSLKEIKVPVYVQTIEDECFANCSNLETIIISQNVISISANAFDGCAAIKNSVEPHVGRVCSDSQSGGYVNSYFLPIGNANGFYLNGLITNSNYQEWYEIYGYL